MERILIVEDSAVARSQLSDILSAYYELEFQGDGENGVAAAIASLPDLILLDIHLPKMDGYDVCRLIKRADATRETPIIFITSMDSGKDRVKGFEAGAEDYIVKPFYPEEMLARVRVHLASKRAREQALEIERLQMFRELAAALSHEINNPLTAIYASLYILEKELVGDGTMAKEQLTEIRRELERIKGITWRLATASKIVRTDYLSGTAMIDLHNI